MKTPNRTLFSIRNGIPLHVSNTGAGSALLCFECLFFKPACVIKTDHFRNATAPTNYLTTDTAYVLPKLKTSKTRQYVTQTPLSGDTLRRRIHAFDARAGFRQIDGGEVNQRAPAR